MICAQYGIDHALQEASSRAVGMKDADRRDGHRQAGVVVDELGEPLLRPLVLGKVPRIEVIVLLLVIRSIFQLLEDLERRLAGFEPILGCRSAGCDQWFGTHSNTSYVHRLLPAKPWMLLVGVEVGRAVRLGVGGSGTKLLKVGHVHRAAQPQDKGAGLGLSTPLPSSRTNLYPTDHRRPLPPDLTSPVSPANTQSRYLSPTQDHTPPCDVFLLP